jgi:outer membrane receptor protein involved in Fe transport
MGMEATFDWLTQYYHTLEGIPLGWSLDMIVPSSRELKPESSLQYYGGLYFKFGDHRISAGAYYKELQGIIYFSEATDFFGSQLGSWKSYIEVGKGTSKGVELLYEKGGEKFTYKIAYTNSRTDRHFAQVNEGRIFLAKYDRPHVLNVQGDYLFIKKDESSEMGVNMMFTYQSGNMESVKSATYLGYLPGWDKDIVLDYYSGINNLRLKPYIRLDLGWYAKFKRVMVTHNVKAGIYNVLNRHNHFSLYYDSEDQQW